MKINFKNVQNELSREELKSLSGGRVSLSIDGGSAKCCWDNDTSNCSVCVTDHVHSCVAGAHIVHC
jgi:hypothetical protein